MPERPWVRIYYDDLIRDYPAMWEDDLQLAAYVRLLATADPMWPTPPELPRSLKDKALQRLRDAGLLVLTGQRFTMKGLDAERNARAERGRPGAAVRWQNERNANADAIALPTQSDRNASRARRAEPSLSDPIRDEKDAPEGEALTWLAKHGCYVKPGNGYHRHLVTAVERHGINAIIGKFDRLAEAGTKDGDMQGFVFGAIDALNSGTRPDLREVAAADREEERRSSLSRRMEATQVRLHDNGAHFEEPSASCPRCKEAKVST